MLNVAVCLVVHIGTRRLTKLIKHLFVNMSTLLHIEWENPECSCFSAVRLFRLYTCKNTNSHKLILKEIRHTMSSSIFASLSTHVNLLTNTTCGSLKSIMQSFSSKRLRQPFSRIPLYNILLIKSLKNYPCFVE